MANNTPNINRSSVNLLPTFFRTEKNSKFLSSTIDQLIKAPSLERIDGYVGSKLGLTYKPTDSYIGDSLPIRGKYQLEPALVIKELDGSIKKAFAIDDLINQLSYHGADTSNLNRLFTPKFNSYNPQINWDKFVNFREYFWLKNGPPTVTITSTNQLDVEASILGQGSYTSESGITFINGLKVRFIGDVYPSFYATTEFYVEGVGNSITLIPKVELEVFDKLSSYDADAFDATQFDILPFDAHRKVPINPEYVTINRASVDKNTWSRYNRWFHKDVIDLSSTANGVTHIVYPLSVRAKRPIVEFNADLQLWNFGDSRVVPVDLIDTLTTDAFSIVESALGYYVDNILIEDGFRIIFNADIDPAVKDKIFQANIVKTDGKTTIDLVEIETVVAGASVVVTSGQKYYGTEWWFNGTTWVFAQQKDVLNQFPLFELYDNKGVSYSNATYHNSDFSGNPVFGYSVGTGVADPVLGFPLEYNNIGVEGTYLFKNYFNSNYITEIAATTLYNVIPTYETYLRINGPTPTYVNVWEVEQVYSIPVIQFQSVETIVNSIELTIFDNPAMIADLEISVFVNDTKKKLTTDYIINNVGKRTYINFVTPLNGSVTPTKVMLKCISASSPNATGTYETPLNLTNNPLNGHILTFTLSEISDHVKSMVDRDPTFIGEFPGVSNLKSLPGISKYGTRLISNQNPLSFAQYFITDPEHSMISAIKKASIDYYQFKNSLINAITLGDSQLTPSDLLDSAMASLVLSKNSAFPYAISDMLGYGKNNDTRSYIVTETRRKSYAITSIYDPTVLSNRAVLVYLNDILLILGRDYEFDTLDAGVTLSVNIVNDDIITIKDYVSTIGSYIPPTPSKLGLYPKYEPAIYIDYNFASGPTKVIQGHDGSITIAFSNADENDSYIDNTLLEYESRVFNNIKAAYNSELIDVNDATPGLFRDNGYTTAEINNLVRGDFLKWASTYGVNPVINDTYNVTNHKTYNFKSAVDYLFNTQLPGSWRSIYKYYFDTDRPNTHPWEMLGFSIKPTWWESQYGPSPYTSGNIPLWSDLERGVIRQGPRAGIDTKFVRAGLSQIIPVDTSGNVIDVREWASLQLNDSVKETDQEWSFGEIGPVEAAWRRSSLWPFAVQKILALTKPASYAAMMFDPSRLAKDITGQYNYGENEVFLSPATVSLFTDTDLAGNMILTSGYSVWVIEHGKLRSSTYLSTLKQDMAFASFNLMHKLGGFASKDKLEIIIDSVSPTTVNPGVVLPNEDYTLFFNVSNPVKTVPISGIIVEKQNGQFVVKGYDPKDPYFLTYAPTHSTTVTVGGKAESFLVWRAGSFYQTGQIVLAESNYYRVLISHTSGAAFESVNFTILRSLPIIGGITVFASVTHSDSIITVPYGTRYNTAQEVYDVITGYGYWLAEQGFIFDEYNSDLAQVLDWRYTGKEFLYWTSHNWANGTVLALSPFANSLKYKFSNAVVDDVLTSFYDYSLYNATGQPFPVKNFSLSRVDGVCTITTKNTFDGLFYVRLNLVQKEHVLIFVNRSMFNDVVYDIETGYRQSRVRLIGFRTASWNGEFLSPGFIYDDAQIVNWAAYTDYKAATIVKYAGKYYSAKNSVIGTDLFRASDWSLIGAKPIAQLLPNFDYKINQFEDFYSMDIDNFDAGQQKMAQHLIGYTPRTYLDNIFVNPIAQYKFYQGFIREKGTRNALDKLSKASIHNLQGEISFNEEWAFRVGSFGNFNSYEEIEAPLNEADFKENSQVIRFVASRPVTSFDPVAYVTPLEMIVDEGYVPSTSFATSPTTYIDHSLVLPTAGYVRANDVSLTAYNTDSILNITDPTSIVEGTTIWIGFKENGGWDVLRYTLQTAKVIDSVLGIDQTTGLPFVTFETNTFHKLAAGDIVSIIGFTNSADGIYKVDEVVNDTHFIVSTTLSSLAHPTTNAILYKFVSVRVSVFSELSAKSIEINAPVGEFIWVDKDATTGKWAVYKKAQFRWTLYRSQVDTVDLSKIKRAITIDTVSQQVVDYLDIIDPLKGKIPGAADREIRYKTAFDPAVYGTGSSAVVVDLDTSWGPEHVGELWWDLSTVKYLWAEQGDLEYRKNAWGKLFPGASIDVYEWVRSEYLPSQWSSLADSVDGISQGMSGQPKFADDSVLSVTQYYNNITGALTTVYYYWVKNTVIVPIHPERKISANETSSMILNPANYGIKYISFLSPDAISVTNIQDTLRSSEININISKDTLDIPLDRHTEWLLLEEGSAVNMPIASLEQKLVDSLLGKDVLNNLVPDPLLNVRNRYGVGIRPKQSMFKDRVQALRNLIDYTNNVLVTTNYIISDFVDFTTLNSKEVIPDISTGLYDKLVENIETLRSIETTPIEQAELTCAVLHGIIVAVNIINPGVGYLVAPTVELLYDEYGVLITTEINEFGQIISTTILDGGSGFITSPTLVVRPFTIIVNIDSESNNKWAKYQFESGEWIKMHTQEYDTATYWDYIDWAASTYNPLTPLATTVDEPYLLNTLSPVIGEYIKIKNQGNGRFIIVERVAENGTFDNEYNLIYSERGTIAFKDTLWNTVNSRYNWDYLNTYDQTLYDQSPDLEISKILLAIKKDIFIGPLKVYWNKFFFKAVKYAMSEQVFLDWAFKTSFISVRNKAGTLDQRTTYKYQNSQYYESYINEVKPYHTKIRTFEIDYNLNDYSQTYSTDFDLPAYYDPVTGKFTPIELNNPLLNSYPRKSWADNYKLSVESVTILDGGHGYQTRPTVTFVPGAGDTGTGTTGIAHIASGKVSSVEILTQGSGYIVPPTVVFTGGFTTLTSTATVLIPITATGYVNITNDLIRSSVIEMKFDRLTGVRELGEKRVTDGFICTGVTQEYTLSWVARHNKAEIDIRLDGITVFATEYDIIDYTRIHNGYHKRYSKVVFKSLPASKVLFTITYDKGYDVYHAVDRITDYYSPTEGMAGTAVDQLMDGLSFPGTQIKTLPLDYSNNWDARPFGQELWGADAFGVEGVVVEFGGFGYTYPPLVVFVEDPADNVEPATAIAHISSGTIISIQITYAGNGYTRAPRVDIISTQTQISPVLHAIVAERDIDTVITGGSFTGGKNTGALGVNPEDVILSGSLFISPDVKSAPEEVVPGEILESLAISVWTQGVNQSGTNVIYGFKMFKDIFGREHYKRLDANSSTYITATLYSTSTTIEVFDTKLLPEPIPSINYAGVISIAGERIEYMTKVGTTLGSLRRGTLGTTPGDSYPIGTSLISQGREQTIYQAQQVFEVLNTSTVRTQSAYTLTGVVNLTLVPKIYGPGSGITLLSNPADQIDVYLAGRLLNKTDMYYLDTTVSYDTPIANIKGSVSTVTSLITTSTIGDAYLDTSTNYVWVYENSVETRAVKGYVYNGLTRKEKEFTVNTLTNQIILNLKDGIQGGYNIKVINRRTSADLRWQKPGISLIQSTTTEAIFLSQGLAVLPG